MAVHLICSRKPNGIGLIATTLRQTEAIALVREPSMYGRR